MSALERPPEDRPDPRDRSPEGRSAWGRHIARLGALAQTGVQRHYPWEAAQRAYVWGDYDEAGYPVYPTMAEVARRFAIPISTVRMYAMKHDWRTRQLAFRAEAEAQERENRMKVLLTHRLTMDEMAAHNAREGSGITLARLQEIAEEHGQRLVTKAAYEAAISAGADPETLQRTGFDPFSPPAIDAREVAALAQAANTFHQVGQRATGGEVSRVELSGPGGEPVQVQSVVTDLTRDDGERVPLIIEALIRAQLGEPPPPLEIDNVEEAEVVSDD